jgi:hypothetical protein
MMKIFFQGIFWYNWLQEMGSEQIMEANIMACDSCANFLVVFVQDEQPDVQGLAVTLVSGRSTTESAVGMNFCTCLCFSCQFLVVAFFSSSLEGEVKTHHLIPLKKDSDILIGSSY